jgi:hypothetical protein
LRVALLHRESDRTAAQREGLAGKLLRARDDERLPTTLTGLHLVAFAGLMLARITLQFHSG